MPNLEARPWLQHHFEGARERDLPTITPKPLIPWLWPQSNYGVVPPKVFPAMNYGTVPQPGGHLRNANWEPGGGGGGTAINNVIYLDGQAIARAVHDYQSADMMHARQASSFNGRESYYGPDWSPIA
jgi:hypothetical protein